ncbi:MAG TPA: ATP-binding protein [Leptospiraceae bacterium]|nr:ATP-binding protein [Leptospiraceae bacterium]HNE09209.1 ATP-binding protein [Leptospiraceae bacterium]HNH00695.1 ATP-binding protein [Leptospiraceae bacterium]HNI87191.1 ATP-binding protein [Leptospiraceae bacterium]
MLKKLLSVKKEYPVIALLGPRQSGKTTLARITFPQKKYINLEDLEVREFAQTDPRGFLSSYPDGCILDEIQRVPELLSYIQVFVDEDRKAGKYIITGSQNLLLMEGISQSLAGRVALLSLLPLSLKEIFSNQKKIFSYEDYIFNGFYPFLYNNKKINISSYYTNYIQTYIEKDVRSLKNISNLSSFTRFVKLCAARAGGILNLSSLADDAGITHNTAKSWISILEASYILFLLPPYFKNFGKRLLKSPKLYFFDTGILCALLGIKDVEQISTHYLKGGIFENFVIMDLYKQFTNKGQIPPFYYWQDKHGKEIDLVIELGNKHLPIEIKSGKTISTDFFNNLNHYKKIGDASVLKGCVVYGGDEIQKRTDADVFSWKNLSSLPF